MDIAADPWTLEVWGEAGESGDANSLFCSLNDNDPTATKGLRHKPVVSVQCGGRESRDGMSRLEAREQRDGACGAARQAVKQIRQRGLCQRRRREAPGRVDREMQRAKRCKRERLGLARDGMAKTR